MAKALDKDRDLRYQSATELRTDLSQLKRDSDSGRLATFAASKKSRLRSFVVTAGVAVVLVAALAGNGLYYRLHQRKPLTDKDTIVIANFDNKTSDAVFDDTLKTAPTVTLNQSPFLNVLPDNRATPR